MKAPAPPSLSVTLQRKDELLFPLEHNNKEPLYTPPFLPSWSAVSPGESYLPAAYGLAESYPITTIDRGYSPSIDIDVALYVPHSMTSFSDIFERQ